MADEDEISGRDYFVNLLDKAIRAENEAIDSGASIEGSVEARDELISIRDKQLPRLDLRKTSHKVAILDRLQSLSDKHPDCASCTIVPTAREDLESKWGSVTARTNLLGRELDTPEKRDRISKIYPKMIDVLASGDVHQRNSDIDYRSMAPSDITGEPIIEEIDVNPKNVGTVCVDDE